MEIIVGRGRSKATQKIEISDPSVSREHCRLIDNGDGTWTLKNISAQGTFVNDRRVVKTTVKLTDSIKMGSTVVKVSDLIPTTGAQLGDTVYTPPKPPVPPTPEYSIRELKSVWEEYHNRQIEIRKEQKSIGNLRSAAPLFTMGSGAIAAIAKSVGWGDSIFAITLTMTAIGLLIMLYCWYKTSNDTSIEDLEAAKDNFERTYICPNPKCNHFMGHQSYHVLRQNKYCPHCKCKLKE